jgi:glycosyltransferase involved in cell wall biosynthesis
MSRQEPFALVLLVAREAGCAIIASDVDGIPQALDGTGVLLPPIM